jgi:hypothetical protein
MSVYLCQKCGTAAFQGVVLQPTASEQYRTGNCLRCRQKRLFVRDERREDPGPRDVREGRRRAERGMGIAEQSEEMSGSNWNIEADAAIHSLAESGAEFTSEDVTRRVGLPHRSPGAVGARMNAAAKRGWIAWTGRMSQAERSNQHAAVLKVWKGIGWPSNS